MKTVLVLALLVVVSLTALTYWLGAFRPVIVTEDIRGPIHFIYRDLQGADMRQVREITDALDTLLERLRLDERQPLQLYFPDGGGQAGFAVAEPGVAMQQRLQRLDARLRVLPRGTYLIAKFPWKNPLSFVLGYWKVEPALARHRKQHGYAQTEALTLLEGDTMTYMQIVARDNQLPAD